MAAHARDRILTSAIRLGQRDGWSGLSVAGVLAESGVARRSFYTHFPGGTSELTVDAVRVSAAWITAIVDEACRQPSHQALASFVEHWTAMLTDSDFTLGCPVAAAAAARPQHPEAADLAAEAFETWEARIAAALHRDGIETAEARRLGALVVVTVEGAVVRCIAARSVEPLALVHEHLQAAFARRQESRRNDTATT